MATRTLPPPTPAKKRTQTANKVTNISHSEASRKNIPTAEYQSVMPVEAQRAVQVAYQRRSPDLDPQLIWRGKYPDHDLDAAGQFTVPAPPLYIQEKVHPNVLIDDLARETERVRAGVAADGDQVDLFADFNGLPNTDAKTEFYQHDQHWSNRMILGDSLQVMASLDQREGLRGRVQCIYIDPPYGIEFNSNFQWSTKSRNVMDGKREHITREPEQVKAFRDTWKYGVSSYLTYLRDRFTTAQSLLADEGSIFVQVGEENVHRVRAVLEEIFGESNFQSQIHYTTTSGFTSSELSRAGDYILWFAKDKNVVKYRELFGGKLDPFNNAKSKYDQVETADLGRRPLDNQERLKRAIPLGARLFRYGAIDSQDPPPAATPVNFLGRTFEPAPGRHWTANYPVGMQRLLRANRLGLQGKSLSYMRCFEDFNVQPLHNLWADIGGGVQSRTDSKVYVVQTGVGVVQRCLLMTTDPGDLVLDPTCGSGTSAYVAEQWGRRWITIDTSRVALALTRARIMGARYPFYLLADSREGQIQEAKLQGRVPTSIPVLGNVREGFVYERVPHIRLGSIANNTEIDIIWEEHQQKLEPLRKELNGALKQSWQEWEIPREASASWSTKAKAAHTAWWELRIARQKAMDASIAAKAEFENLYDKPYEDKSKVRVAGPFTVESLSPHRVLEMMDDELASSARTSYDDPRDAGNFVQVILNTLKQSGVQQADKHARIEFTSLVPWPGDHICAEGRYAEQDGLERRAAVMIGPEFGTVSRPDLVSAAREAEDAGFDVLVACAFNFDAQSTEFSKLGRIPVLKARMNADLHMAADLKNNGKGNLFVVFGEPDIEIHHEPNGELRVEVKGVDVFNPSTGEVTSSEPDEIACWFVDTDYNAESFFVRQAYFLGANDPYKSLKTTLKAEINEEAWESLHSPISRAFPRPVSGRIAVKVINHLGDEVMKVFTVV